MYNINNGPRALEVIGNNSGPEIAVSENFVEGDGSYQIKLDYKTKANRPTNLLSYSDSPRTRY